MFPTFISILDIQSWWEVPSIAHFCSLFRAAFNLLDFDIEDLEEALLTDGTEENSWLQELIVRLLSGCLANNEISTFNYQMFLRRLFRQKCQEHDRYNPFNTDIDFQFLPLRTKVEILQALCDFRLDADDVLDHLKNLEADSLRVEPLGYDDNESAYWYFYGTRLYREDFTFKNNKKVKCVWQVICFTEDDWYQLARKFRKSSSKAERQLYRTLSENFQPELPRLFQEKEVLHRKRLLEWLPRRTSTRLDVKRQQNKDPEPSEPPDEEDQKDLELAEDSKSRRKHRSSSGSCSDKGKRRNSHKEPVETQPVSVTTDGKQEVKRHAVEMAERRKQRELRSLNREKTKETAAAAGSTSPVKGKAGAAANMPGLTTVGRQTNNSLASATGQIVIQSVSNPNRKKLKTSQVFRQSEEDLQTGMYKILEAVKNHEDAWPFVEPVEEEYAPNYYTIIRRPMDLQRMEDKLDSGHYMSFNKFKQDFQLIVDNCRLYNGSENEYSEMVENLLEAFQRATDRYLDQITSSDEEIAVEFQERKDARPGSTTGVPPTPATVTPINQNKRKKGEPISNSGPKRKPTSMAHVADKRDRSASVESSQRSESPGTKPEKNKVTTRGSKIISNKSAKNAKNDSVKNVKRETKRNKKAQSPSPERSRSPKRTSRSPSWPPSSPEHWKSAEKRDTSPTVTKTVDSDDETVAKAKGKHKHWKEVFKDKKKLEKETPKPKEIPKHKDKNIKLKETIEKLKAKNDLLISEDGILKTKNNDKPKVKQVEKEPIKEEKSKIKDKINKKPVINKTKPKQPIKNKNLKCEYDFDEEGSTKDSSISKKVQKKPVKKAPVKNVADIDALAIATEQTLKDINKWLDDAPRFSEFSSASNSPAHFIGAEETDPVATKIDQEYRKTLKMDKPPAPPRPRDPKDIFKRRTTKDPSKLHRRKEVQRTIDRLQPGKSKGNLILNIQSTNKPEELFPLGPLSKLRESKNSLTVKTDDAAPKLSLGSVLDTFGQQHNFNEVEEKPKEVEPKVEESDTTSTVKLDSSDDKKEDEVKKDEVPVKIDPMPEKKEPKVENKATPNLSAWFKAFGAPKVQAQPKKKPEVEEEKKETIDLTQDAPKPVTAPVEAPQPPQQPLQTLQKPEEVRKAISPEPESPAGGAPRQRRGSTGSSISERSSFSQDMDSSPRMSIDERIGVYPAPYPSPLHRSPAGASPVMASPHQEEPQRPPYPTVNGSIRVGFYQDTVSTKSSPDKSCSPRDQPQSPYAQYSEHVYPNTSTNAGFSYTNPPYYSQNPPPAYANTNPSPVYGDRNPPTYYDTTKPLTDQYNAKVPTAFPVEEPPSTPEAEYKNPVPPVESYRRAPEKQTTMFPVKKRLYSENELNRKEPLPRSEEIQQIEQIDLTDSNDFGGARSLEMGLMTGRQLNINTGQQQQQPQQHPSPALQELRPASREAVKQYLTSPQPEIRNESPNFTRSDNRGTIKPYDGQIDMTNRDLELNMALQSNPAMRPMNFATTTTTNMYLQNHDNAYSLNMSVNNRNMETRPQESDERKLDMSKLTNMGYLPPQTNVDMSRTPQYQSLNYNRPPSRPETQQNPEHMNLMRYQESRGVMGYRMDPPRSEPQAQPEMLQVPQRPITSMGTGNYKAPDMTIPRPAFNTPSSLGMDQSLNLRGNLANLSHIVDRYNQDERLLNSLQTSSAYYSDKSQHMFAKGMPSSNAVTSSLQMFSQPMSYGQQTPTSLAFTRTMTELQNHAIMVQAGKNQMQHQVQQVQQQQQQIQQQQQQTQPVQVEKKSSGRKRKSKQQPQVAAATESSQGFQSYAGLKNAEPSAISLKTTSVVPGSAFNFGPTATGLGLPTGLYGDKDGYTGYLDEYRPATNYYMAAAAHAHRTTPEATTDKPARAAHQQTPGPTPSFPFLGHPQPRAPGYPSLASPFMNPHQPPLMDPSSPLYQQYLHSAGVLHQGLLAPPTGYPPGYHPALSMRQPYDSMPRPSWL